MYETFYTENGNKLRRINNKEVFLGGKSLTVPPPLLCTLSLSLSDWYITKEHMFSSYAESLIIPIPEEEDFDTNKGILVFDNEKPLILVPLSLANYIFFIIAFY